MKVIYIDCAMGAAGDMLQGALVSLLTGEEQESFINEINNAGIPGVRVSLAPDEKCGVKCSHITVKVHDTEEETHDLHDHNHHHDHDHNHNHTGNDNTVHAGHPSHDISVPCDSDNNKHSGADGNNGSVHTHEHTHHHATLGNIYEIIDGLIVSDAVKRDAKAVYEIIAAAESKVHGKSVSEVHFHEVGTLDAVTDVTGVAMLMECLRNNYGIESVICSPINTGYGKVKCAHGILDVPAPATAEIIKGMPTYAGAHEGEMLTPTGAALIKYYTSSYGDNPIVIETGTGAGSGRKDFPEPNVVRVYLGTM